MSYIRYHPKGDTVPLAQSDQQRIHDEHFRSLEYADMLLFTLFNALMGSGKTFNARALAEDINSKLVIVLSAEEGLMNQTMNEFRKHKNLFVINGSSGETHDSIVKKALSTPVSLTPVVFFNNIGHVEGKFNNNATALIHLMNHTNKLENRICIIDEIDVQLTKLTGGLNAKDQQFEEDYVKICSQSLENSLNIFDKFRLNNIKCIGYTGTGNHIVSSKMYSMGYNKEDVSIVNVYPIEAIYTNTNIIPVDFDDFNSYKSLLEKPLKGPIEEKIMIACPDENAIEECHRRIVKEYGKISNVRITHRLQRSGQKYIDSVRGSKIIYTINMAARGFDLGSFYSDSEKKRNKSGYFTRIVQMRDNDDKISVAVAKNPHHDLYNPLSSTTLQTACRARSSKCIVLIPKKFSKACSLYQEVLRVSDLIHKCCTSSNFMSLGPAKVLQKERYAQAWNEGLILNIRGDDVGERNTVDKHITIMKTTYNYDYPKEIKAEHHYKTSNSVCEQLLDSYTHQTTAKTSEIVDLAHVIPSCFKAGSAGRNVITGTVGIVGRPVETGLSSISIGMDETMNAQITKSPMVRTTEGGGYKNSRQVDEVIKLKVITRATCCCHCGKKLNIYDKLQICHVKRNDQGGPYSLDNLMYGHIKCDAVYDGGGLIHDPKGGYWREDTNLYKPDLSQLKYMNSRYIYYRWLWELSQAHWGGVSEATFRDELKQRSYVYFK